MKPHKLNLGFRNCFPLDRFSIVRNETLKKLGGREDFNANTVKIRSMRDAWLA